MASKMAAKIANLYTKSVISLGRPNTFESCHKGSGDGYLDLESHLIDPP